MSRTERDSPAEGTGSSERSPLLSRDADAAERPLSPPAPRKPRLGILPACILLILLVELCAYLINLPLNPVLEDIICRQHHPPSASSPFRRRDDDHHASPCKDKAVQAELSLLRGWQSTFDFVPGLFAAVPYGLLADRRSREFVLGLSLLGLTLASAFYVLVCALDPSPRRALAPVLCAADSFAPVRQAPCPRSSPSA